MSFDKSFANNERLVFYPKFFRRFFCFLPMASMLIGIGFLAEFMMVRGGDYYGSAKRGSGYAIAAAFALWAIYITICLMNERLTIDQTAVCIEPINGEFYSLAKPPERYGWKKIALIKQTGRFFRNYDFYTAAGERYGTISYRSWRHSKKLQSLIIGRVLAQGGRFEVEPPRPHVPLTKRVSAAIPKVVDAIKGQFIPR